jgi:hypothetical protein
MHPYFPVFQPAFDAEERAMRNVWLGLALVPYLAAAGVDAWMHERGRRVPRAEQLAHAGLAATLVVFLTAVFVGKPVAAMVALAVFLAFLVWDEMAFHGSIGSAERRVHTVSWAALAAFVAAWGLLDLA